MWPILANEEAIAVSQSFVGDTGDIVASSTTMVKMHNCRYNTYTALFIFVCFDHLECTSTGSYVNFHIVLLQFT